jgi:hypothetical protein
MKKLYSLLLLSLVFRMVAAQTSGGPDTYGTIWRDSNDPNGPAYSWIDISNRAETMEISGLADDNFVGPFFLPAPFPYYWYTVDKFWIGSNGYIAFGPTQFAHPFPLIPTPNGANDYLAAMMTDLNFVNTGAAGAGNPAACYYWKNTAMDSAIISFDSVPFWTSGTPQWTGSNSFQIVLNYSDSTITYQYKDQNGVSLSTLDYVTVGIENASGTIGLQYAHDAYPPTQYAIRFYQPSSSTLQINDAASVYNDNPTSGARFVSRNVGGAFSLQSMVKNAGNTALGSFSVTGQVKTLTNATVVTNTFQAGPLPAQQSQLINYTNPFIPTNAGTFRYINTTTLAGDAVPSNDPCTLELQVVDTTLTDIELKYDNGIAAAAGISWNGGDGGCANYFIPPFYPCDVTKVSAHIVADPNAVGYSMLVLDDDGPNGSAGTVLDSISVASGSIITGTFTTSQLTQPVRIDSGGFYVAWVMNGDGVALGQNQVTPLSNRAFEILGGVLADYRYREVEDLMIRATISRVATGIAENTAERIFGPVYPNPSSNRIYVDVDNALIKAPGILVRIFDATGRIVSSNLTPVSGNRIELSTSELANGLYTARFSLNAAEVSRKFTIAR